MSEADRAVAAPLELEYKGVTYRLAEHTLEMTGLMVARLRRRTVEAIEQMWSYLPEPEFEEWRKATVQLIAGGKFDYGSTSLADWSFSAEGMQYGAFLQLHKNHPEVTEEFVAEMWDEIRHKIATSMEAQAAANPPQPPPGGEVQA